MHRSERGTSTTPPRRVGARTVLVMLACGSFAAACTSSSTSSTAPSTTETAPSGGGTTATTGGGSAAALRSVVSGIKRSSGATFSATYLTANSTTGKSQTVTFAQSPPKSAVVTPGGSFYIDGKSVTECQGSGAAATCTSLPTSLGSSLSGITDLFSPGVLTDTLRGIEAEAVAHVAGVSTHTSSATYGGLPSTCFTLKSASQPNAVTYCAADSSGILTYSSTNGSTVTLTSFTANPPASTFSPPAGATVQTLPSGA